ncbi:MAG TPA: hypothetical protein VKB88_20850, partial [Bryobacteraceae bacterium]|nr:hypothetical protein [Bryobacteraceae bacterium]
MTRREFGALVAALSASRANASRPLDTLRRVHPRIVTDAAGFERVRQLVTNDPLPKRWYRAIRAQAADLLSAPPSVYEIADGKRLLPISRQVKERVQTLALVYRMDRDPRMVGRVWREIEAAAHFKDWNPSHFLDTAEMTYAFSVA